MTAGEISTIIEILHSAANALRSNTTPLPQRNALATKCYEAAVPLWHELEAIYKIKPLP